MDLNQALREGPNFVKNAEDALGRNITNPDLLYLWDNQVAAIDGYLANTEPLVAESPELAETRSTLRDLKKQLEKKVMTFEAEQEGEEVPEDPPEEEVIVDFKAFGADIAAMADEALKEEVKEVSDLHKYEEPRDLINGFLADSEPFKDHDKQLGKMRDMVRKRKETLDERIRSIEQEWRERDLAAGA